MTTEQEALYSDMQLHMENVQQCGLPASAEVCTTLACEYWEKLKETISLTELEKPEAAINFFRNVKPEFTGEIRYYTILHQAWIAIPKDAEKRKLHWKDQAGRYNRFYEVNSGFIRYFESGQRELDGTYFTAATEANLPAPQMDYDSDTRYCSAKDYLVAEIMAEKRFHTFAKRQLVINTMDPISFIQKATATGNIFTKKQRPFK